MKVGDCSWSEACARSVRQWGDRRVTILVGCAQAARAFAPARQGGREGHSISHRERYEHHSLPCGRCRCDGPRLRLHERFPRLVQCDGDVGGDRRLHTQKSGSGRRRAQRDRSLPVNRGFQDDLSRDVRRRGDRGGAGHDLRGSGRRHPVEPGDLVVRTAVVVVPCAVRRTHRSGRGGGRGPGSPLGDSDLQDHSAGRHRTGCGRGGGRTGHSAGLPHRASDQSVLREALPQQSAGHRIAGGSVPWHV